MRKTLLIAIVFALTLTGCGSNPIDATVNGEKITKEQVDTIIQAQRLTMVGSKVTDSVLRKGVVDSLVNQTILKQEAKKEGLTISSKDLEARYQQTMTNWDTNKTMQISLASQGFTKSNMKELLETQMLIQALAQENSQVSDVTMSNYYKTHVNDYSLYTVKRYVASTEKEALSGLPESKKFKTLTFPANQLPYTIQQQLHAGHKFDKPEVVKISEGSWWAFSIEKIEAQTFEQVKTQVNKTIQMEQQQSKLQLLLQDLKSKATISHQQ